MAQSVKQQGLDPVFLFVGFPVRPIMESVQNFGSSSVACETSRPLRALGKPWILWPSVVAAVGGCAQQVWPRRWPGRHVRRTVSAQQAKPEASVKSRDPDTVKRSALGLTEAASVSR